MYRSESIPFDVVHKKQHRVGWTVIWTTIVTVVIGVLLIPVLSGYIAQANPNKCPPGQERKEGCKWVQFQGNKNDARYGKCMWLPEDAVANPWVVVPENTCPELEHPTATVAATATVMPLIAPSSTPFMPPSATPNGDPVDPTATLPGGQPQKTATPTCTLASASNNKNASGNKLTATVQVCDICSNQATMAAALSTIAAGDAIRLQTQVASGK